MIWSEATFARKVCLVDYFAVYTAFAKLFPLEGIYIRGFDKQIATEGFTTVAGSKFFKKKPLRMSETSFLAIPSYRLR